MAKDDKHEDPAPGDKSTPAIVEEPAPKIYRVLVADGISWENRRARYGSRRSDIPEQSIRWLVKGGYIEEVTDTADTGEQGDQDADI
jgi:hypothetical protein